jgi:Restriction endonuclease
MNPPNIYTVTLEEVHEAEGEVRRCERSWRESGGFAGPAESQIEQALRHAEHLQSILAEATAKSRPTLELRYYQLVHLFAQTGVARLEKAAFVAYASAAICGLSFLVDPFLFATLRAALIGSLVTVAFGICLVVAAAIGFWPDDVKTRYFHVLEREWVTRIEHVETLQLDKERAWAGYQALLRYRVLIDQLERAYACRRQLAKVVASAKYQLIHTDWRGLRGVPFEGFLANVFRALGYQVETTKASGDQGVDLILTGKGKRIAVQAKGYEGNVSNHAVMEANSGMKYYKCDLCMVITNSSFTRAAVEHATGVNCLLVDGDHIPNLIEGRII